MSINVAYRNAQEQLTAFFGEGEGYSLTRILFEDLFDWHTGRRDRAFTAGEAKALLMAQQRLQAGEPVQYITHRADFFGLVLYVDNRVLIPRPETEELVEWVLEERARWTDTAVRILDIGTGSGCIPLAIKKRWPSAEVWGVDVSTEALAVARRNADTLGLEVHCQQLDVLDSKQWGSLPTFDIIISNPPYIPTREAALMPEQVKAHEPHLALFVDNAEPLIFYETILRFGRQQASASTLFFECNEFNAQDVAAAAEGLDYKGGALRRDLQGKWRMWRGSAP